MWRRVESMETQMNGVRQGDLVEVEVEANRKCYTWKRGQQWQQEAGQLSETCRELVSGTGT
jgi:hypothetical protein